MDHFNYQDRWLAAENVPLTRIAEAVGTPTYVYSSATLTRHYRVFSDALRGVDALICYAVKANPNLAIVRTLGRLGSGADVVSGGELKIALDAGIPAARIVFSGVGKTEDEIAAALDAGVLQLNAESEPELRLIARIAEMRGVVAPVAIRINPDVDARTHAKISTGLRENKFGIEWTAAHQVFAWAAGLPSLQVRGVAVHIGSQLTTIAPFEQAFHRLRDLVVMLRADGFAVDRLDLGGGLGVPYGNEGPPDMPTPEGYGEMVRRTVGDLGCRLLFEPGRLLVANAGVLLTRVLFVKEGATRTFVIVDAGMNDLLRPALYEAFHDIVPVRQSPPDEPVCSVDVVGPVCETADTFARARALPTVAAGDLLAIRTAGAYGAAMASGYNARPLPAEVLVDGNDFSVVAERLALELLEERRRLPDWLKERLTPVASAEAKS